MTIATLIGTIVTALAGPLLAWWLKRWWENKAAAIEAERVARLQEEVARKNSDATSAHAGTVNSSIDEQRKAREEWAKKNGG